MTESDSVIDEKAIEAAFEERMRTDPKFAELMRRHHLRRQPFEYQRCDNCIYFLNSNQWCDHPDFQITVRAAWWCSLWRI